MRKRRYKNHKARANPLVNAILAESVDTFYTKADNALFLLEVVGRVCAAFAEQQVREPEMWSRLLGEDK